MRKVEWVFSLGIIMCMWVVLLMIMHLGKKGVFCILVGMCMWGKLGMVRRKERALIFRIKVKRNICIGIRHQGRQRIIRRLLLLSGIRMGYFLEDR